MTRSLLVVLLAVSAGCEGVASSNLAVGDEAREGLGTTTLPEAPLVTPSLRVFTADTAGKNAGYAQWGLPSHNGEFTPDGRLMAKNQCPHENDARVGDFCFQVFRPEVFARAGSLQAATANDFVNAYSTDLEVDPTTLVADTRYTFQKGYLCMPGTTPVRAGAGGRDLYDLTIVMLLSDGNNKSYLASRKATVTVSNAKSTSAAPAAVALTSPLTVAEMPFKNLPELNFARDGKLAAGRYEGLVTGSYSWQRSTKVMQTETDDSLMFYLFSQTPCDVGEWVKNGFKPLPAASFDPAVNGTYGFAKQPIRVMNTSGSLVTLGEGDKLWGSYAWIDPTGANVIYFKSVKGQFVTGAKAPEWANGATLNGTSVVDLRALTADEKKASLDDTVPITMMVGSWTWGREVALDGRLSLADIPVSVRESQTDSRVNVLRLPKFYSARNSNDTVGIELDETTRGAPASNYWGTNKHLWVKSGIRFSSITNLFNAYPFMQPRTKRDVVWYVTKGHVTDEVVFDDSLDPNVLVFSEMNAAVPNDELRALCDGSGCGANGATWVQNAASGAVFDVPAKGVVTNALRLEPVAAGGVFGRGLWLERDTTVAFEIPAQRSTAPQAFSWYAGASFDVRPGGAQTQTLVTVGGLSVEGSMVAVNGKTLYRLKVAGDSCSVDVDRPAWHSVALASRDGGVQLVVDGKTACTTTLQAPDIFNATVTFGGGVRGWVDQTRVMVDTGRMSDGQKANWPEVAPELFCNWARGTLDLREGQRVCVRDGSPLVNPQREEVLLSTTGRLYADAPRSNTTGNSFCTTCHAPKTWVRAGLNSNVDSLLRPALTVAPPGATPVPVPEDPRRQPMQPPANRLGPGITTCSWGTWSESNTRLTGATSAPDRVGECMPLDKLVLPLRP